jgi:NADPH-dependent 2,4-dienoyl-CoA reductase/sulfur reductase-like enzyme
LNNIHNILIVGGGPAGTFAALAAKQQKPAASVTLLSEEHCEPYEKPPLSKAVLLGKISPNDSLIAGPKGVAGSGVILEAQARCTAIDRSSHSVLLQGGRRLRYDMLVLATGAIAREIPQLPVDMPGVHYLRTEAHARVLKSELKANRKLLVIGGGLIGLEVAASAAELGLQTTVLEVAPRILMRVCDEETSAVVHAAHQQRGVDIRVNTALSSISRLADGRIKVGLVNGTFVTADLVVVGVGSVPNDSVAATAGLQVNDGIIIDEYCRTSDPAIFAAGDAVRFPGPKGLIRLENWRHAQDQGVVAGSNAAGADIPYVTVPSFWSEQYDLYIQGIGWSANGSTRIRRVLGGDGSLSFHVRDNRLVFVMGINAQRDIAIARRLIERSVPVELTALSDPSQPLSKMVLG